MQFFFFIGYFIVGIAQLFAIMDGVEYALDVGSFISVIIAMFTTYIPLLGSILGVYGAYIVWDWSLLASIALFFWYVPVFLFFVAVGAFTER